MSLLSFYSRNAAELVGLTWQHVYLVGVSTGAAIVVGVPLGIALTRRPAWRAPVLALANVFQTIPSLALFGFLIPVFGIGAWTAITALIVYALLRLVELPLAAGVILAGIRVATVVSVGVATIGAAIGAGGLGVYIFRGVATVDDTLIMAGALPAALMALAADGALGFVERRVAWGAK